jgi:probable rRNA maturation factor
VSTTGLPPTTGPQPPELDLAFSLSAGLPAALLRNAGPLAAADQAEAHWQQQLSAWLEALAAELPPTLRASAYSLGLELCDDTAIAELNAAWRQKSGATDVLAFAAQEEAPPLPPAGLEGLGPAETEPLELGDIVISLETAARQAVDHGHALEWELRFLASHGLLHLLGWDHPDATSLAAMLERQERLMGGSGTGKRR